jgi:hypothetical protein
MRYFFNVHMDGQEIADCEGSEFESFDAAHSEAARIACELLRDFSIEIDRSSTLEVLDEDGTTVLNLPVHGSPTLH